MLNIYCWSCGTQVSKEEVLGLGHFDQNIGKYKGKAFITFKCKKCNKVRYQILNKNLLSRKKQLINNRNGKNNHYSINEQEKININHVIDFSQSLNDINTMEKLLNKCKMSTTTSDIEQYKYKEPINQPIDVFNLFNELNKSQYKRLMILTLNNDNYPITWEFLGEGLNKNINYNPKVIFHTPFLLDEETSIILAENVNEIKKEPSEANVKKTKKLVKAGDLLGINFIDHIIIEENDYQSYNELKLI
ncbi:MAG: JAB domain-containing protein [bacterium]